MSDLETIRARLLAAPRIALFLDYDGTLVPIAATPEAARPDEELLDLLARLAAHPRMAALGIVSGRTIANLGEMGLRIPGVALAGTHGAEIAPAHGGPPIELFDRAALAPRLDALREAARRLADPARGFRLEDKDLAIAFHYRLADPVDGPRRAAKFARLARDPLFDAIVGKKVIEVRPRGAHKGAAALALLERAGAPALPAYLGDDMTDEDAFRALAERGGLTAVVAPEPRPTAAEFRLTDPGEVRELLRALAAPPAPA